MQWVHHVVRLSVFMYIVNVYNFTVYFCHRGMEVMKSDEKFDSHRLYVLRRNVRFDCFISEQLLDFAIDACIRSLY